MTDRSRPHLFTDRKKRFVLEYLKDANATQAAIRAGYSLASAKVTGSKLLKDPDVASELDFARDEEIMKAKVTRDGHLIELANLRDLAKQEGKLSAAVQAEGMRGKVAGLYIEHIKAEVSQLPTVTIE